MIEVAGLCHGFRADDDAAVLDDVSLHLDDGEFVSIIGPSGCGKSTLLRILAGLLTRTAGEVRIDGSEMPLQPGFAAFMPQHDRLLEWRRALDNAVLAADIHGIDPQTSRNRAASLFDRFGLAGFERAWPAELSGGMRQRVAVLRTFLADRELLLLDEPFGALDAITRRRMHTWLQEVLTDAKRTVLFVTHDVDEALFLSDRVLVMSARPGRIIGEIEVVAPRPRDAGTLTAPWFVARKADLLRRLEDAVG